MYLILLLGLGLSVVVAVLFYFMQEAFLANRQARYANEKIRALIDSSPMAIYALDTNGKVVDFWNKAAEELLGWKREEVIGKFLPHVSEEHKEEFWGIMEESFESGSLKNREIVRERKDGSKGYFRLNLGHVITDRNKDRLMMAILEDITQEVAYQKELENSVKEKEVLLTEIHHRVKNNLAIIAGLIELQKDGVEDTQLSEILNETQNRIYSISGVHELLYQTDSFTEITFEEYAVKLIQRIRGMFESKGKEVDINYQFNTRHLNINQAIPLGLLINELITNSFKHAFDKQDEGEIFLSLSEANGRINGEYRDNGKGFSNEVFEQSNTLGVTLIKTLIGQLDADYSINAANGLLFKFSFVVKEKGAHSNITGS